MDLPVRHPFFSVSRLPDTASNLSPLLSLLAPASNNTFSVTYYLANNFTVLTMLGPGNNQQSILYCGEAAFDPQALVTYSLSTTIPRFKVPVQHVATTGNFTSSYVEVRIHSIVETDSLSSLDTASTR